MVLDSWEIIYSYFENHGINAKQIDSFNYFLKYSIQECIESLDPIDISSTRQFHFESKHDVCHRYVLTLGKSYMSRNAIARDPITGEIYTNYPSLCID